MRCARIEPLVEGYVDGVLDAAQALAVEAHAQGCTRCASRIAAARLLVERLANEPAVRAPRGFTDRVMNAVYREALAGRPHAVGPRPDVQGDDGARRVPARVYHRLGLSFVLTAGVLAVSLLVPRIAYMSLMGSVGAAGIADGGSLVVRDALDGADSVVKGILREQENGGNTK